MFFHHVYFFYIADHSLLDGGFLFSHFSVIAFLPATSNILRRYLSWLLSSVGILPKYTVPKLKLISKPKIDFISDIMSNQ